MELKAIRTLTLNMNDFDAEKTFLCGQCFRWRQVQDAFIGVVNRSVIKIHTTDVSSHEVKVTLYGADLSDDYVQNYFDMQRNYRVIASVLSAKDEHLAKAMAYGKGIRVLNQDPFETLISFIISSNNNIPKIKMTLEALSEKFGTCIGMLEQQLWYAFPKVEDLCHVPLEALNVKAIGYRSKAVKLTCEAIVEENLDLSTPFSLSYEAAQKWLMHFYGVGEKVADCVLLFAYKHDEAFPVDTWVKKVLGQLYDTHKNHSQFINEYFTAYAGIAQQYLFYYMRNQKG